MVKSHNSCLLRCSYMHVIELKRVTRILLARFVKTSCRGCTANVQGRAHHSRGLLGGGRGRRLCITPVALFVSHVIYLIIRNRFTEKNVRTMKSSKCNTIWNRMTYLGSDLLCLFLLKGRSFLVSSNLWDLGAFITKVFYVFKGTTVRSSHTTPQGGCEWVVLLSVE
jgi:hypothetical protein